MTTLSKKDEEILRNATSHSDFVNKMVIKLFSHEFLVNGHPAAVIKSIESSENFTQMKGEFSCLIAINSNSSVFRI